MQKPNQRYTPPDKSGRIAFQTVAIVSLGMLLAEKLWRLYRDLSEQNQRGRG